jgi:hypothetical protein
MKMIGFEIKNNSDQFRDLGFVNPVRSRSHRALVALIFEESRLISSCLLKMLPPILNFCQISVASWPWTTAHYPQTSSSATHPTGPGTQGSRLTIAFARGRWEGRESIWMQDHPMEY